ncbi:50S ribosomal protein L22 [Candidatus Campbellbacteria bacterium CG22_combo_CG10-13_8_21_14_all_36_13]|uniref:Large ribosomal subunit protein uL22 n=1 Tax=Candidatus Campbellbacteria bacterium CG22_combo_CG10-13_8_21_14_all_36_13 TaxID=1974529 RepID=A0A2H0DYS6_9BACT|nr:MAG: 50S ribosomal protein L22 [Candidatus Campbellbacteria bacterium CG22_combo_CG10-13_8_21_14_all_36_13]
MKATLKNYRQSPRKVRLVASLIKGKAVNRALDELRFTPKRASDAISKLINSAVSNAKSKEGVDADKLFIKSIQVNEGRTLHRSMPMSRGRAFRIRKRSSHIDVELTHGIESTNKTKS